MPTFTAGSPPRYALSVRGQGLDEKNDVVESKGAFLVVALCPCLVCFIPPHRNFHLSHCQIPFLLPHPTSLFALQEKLLTPTLSRFTIPRLVVVPNVHLLGNVVGIEYSHRIRGFSSATAGGSDSDSEIDSEDEARGEWEGNEGVHASSSGDPEEVDRMRNYDMGCAVWDEMIQKGCCPDDNSYTVLIGGLISQGRSGRPVNI
ncbi:pentatricopeptide repeat-containing protein [Prunus yedoensis var. nudiflora]|uniref:Pentatricopeptide repeat-containing protein n=1 Tax=Prunus yedoensis var. nudiflora TaxID=2094558 RepID=A0A314Z9C3_PRUYE|nr:pentatricopeptide repeat-containing protein [Prunus yedoensis var. nudiflora]